MFGLNFSNNDESKVNSSIDGAVSNQEIATRQVELADLTPDLAERFSIPMLNPKDDVTHAYDYARKSFDTSLASVA